MNRRGCPWAMLPHALLPQRTVEDSVAPWRAAGIWTGWVQALRERHRGDAGREPTPSAAGLESPSGKPTERGGPARGYEGGKNRNGRKRPLWVETLGVLLTLVRTRAGLADGVAALNGLGPVTPQAVPRLVTILAEQT